MKYLYLLPVAALFFLAGCCSVDLPVPAGTAKEIAYQLEDEPEVLLIPVCDYGDKLELAAPRKLSHPYQETAELTEECNSFWSFLPWVAGQPARFLLLTPSGELYSGTAENRRSVKSGVRFYRTRLDRTALDEFTARLQAREFMITEADSLFLAPESFAPETPLPVTPRDPESDWSEAFAFLESVTPFELYSPPTMFNRSYGRHGIYCAAQKSHIKPDYAPGTILTLVFQPEQPVLLGKEKFSDRAQLRKSLELHLKSGLYALLKLQLLELEDVFELERDGIAPLLRELADTYGSDFVIELPGGNAIWRCSRCFAQP